MRTLKLFGTTLSVLALVLNQSTTFAVEYFFDDIEIPQVSTLRSVKELTPEEEALANEAKAQIAKAIEDNLIRLLAVASARGDRRPRQDDEDDEFSVTPNPNVLPQVAQILGAIFTGSLNITRVVDQTFGLVPNIVRNQVGGIVKLITGDNKGAANATVPANSTKVDSTTTPVSLVTSAAVINQTTTESVVILEAKSPEPTTEKVVELDSTANTAQDTGVKVKYRIRNRTRGTSTTTKSPLEDDEIEKLEDDLRRRGRALAPEVKGQDPNLFASLLKNVVSRIDFNSSEVASAVPSIFKGTKQAFTVLENLGILDVNDVLDELDLPTLEEEEEDEE